MKINSFLKETLQKAPISGYQYFLHSILILDVLLYFFRNSYDPLIPRIVAAIIIGFDLLVALIWARYYFLRLREEKYNRRYIQSRWYMIVGLIPFPFFRIFLLISTLKLGILSYKFLKRGEQDKQKFLEKEIDFSFADMFINAISDAVFLQSLDRVQEVTVGMDYTEVAKDILQKHKNELKQTVAESMHTKSIIGRLEQLPFMSGLADQMSEDVTSIIIETLEREVVGDIMKELNLHILGKMRDRVIKLDLDRILEDRKRRSYWI